MKLIRAISITGKEILHIINIPGCLLHISIGIRIRVSIGIKMGTNIGISVHIVGIHFSQSPFLTFSGE